MDRLDHEVEPHDHECFCCYSPGALDNLEDVTGPQTLYMCSVDVCGMSSSVNMHLSLQLQQYEQCQHDLAVNSV